MRRRIKLHHLLPLIGVVLFALAAWVLYRELRVHGIEALLGAVRAMSAGQIALACVFTVLGYAILTGYDFLSLRYVGKRLPYRRAAFAALIAYGISNTLGHSFLTGGTLRLRLYTLWGLTAGEVVRVIAFSHLTFYFSVVVLIGISCVVQAGPVAMAVGLPIYVVRPIGAVMLLLIAGYLIWIARRRRPLRFGQREFPIPTLRLSFAQLLVGSLDLSMIASVLWVLLPDSVTLSFAGFLGLFMVAQVLGSVSQVPGGLGVFELIILHALQSMAQAPELMAALIVFRLTYHLTPLSLATLTLGIYEARVLRRPLLQPENGTADERR